MPNVVAVVTAAGAVDFMVVEAGASTEVEEDFTVVAEVSVAEVEGSTVAEADHSMVEGATTAVTVAG